METPAQPQETERTCDSTAGMSVGGSDEEDVMAGRDVDDAEDPLFSGLKPGVSHDFFNALDTPYDCFHKPYIINLLTSEERWDCSMKGSPPIISRPEDLYPCIRSEPVYPPFLAAELQPFRDLDTARLHANSFNLGEIVPIHHMETWDYATNAAALGILGQPLPKARHVVAKVQAWVKTIADIHANRLAHRTTRSDSDTAERRRIIETIELREKEKWREFVGVGFSRDLQWMSIIRIFNIVENHMRSNEAERPDSKAINQSGCFLRMLVFITDWALQRLPQWRWFRSSSMTLGPTYTVASTSSVLSAAMEYLEAVDTVTDVHVWDAMDFCVQHIKCNVAANLSRALERYVALAPVQALDTDDSVMRSVELNMRQELRAETEFQRKQEAKLRTAKRYLFHREQYAQVYSRIATILNSNNHKGDAEQALVSFITERMTAAKEMYAVAVATEIGSTELLSADCLTLLFTASHV